MHTLESHALACGAKIDKPFVYKAYFPLPIEKYILFRPENKIPAKDYFYWQDVINCLSPKLEENNIKILQIGNPDAINYGGVVNLCGKVSLNQIAYLMEKSLLFFGVNGVESQIAGSENKPIVSISSASYANNNGPYFGEKNNQLVFESFLRTDNKKPSFNEQENPKTINLIKPEEIADSILEKLNINFKIPFETTFTGSKYSHFSIQESLPNYKKAIFNPEGLVEIRADVTCDDESLGYQLSQYKKSLLIMDKPVNINLLKQFKQNIANLVFKITETDQLDFLKKLRDEGLKVILISDLDQSKLEKLKIKYYSFGAINPMEKPRKEKVEELKKDKDLLYYRSSKTVASNEKLYYSLAAVENNIVASNNYEYQKVIDSPSFWDNLDFFTIVKLKA
jgi:hypothetical protein